MRHTFILPVKPLSINSTYYSNKGHGKTADAQDWFHTVFYTLDKAVNQTKLTELRGFFDPTKHGLRFGITVFVPEKLLYTKDGGKLSSKTVDLSNLEKSIVDAFCLPAHAEKQAPYGCQNLQIDDRYVNRLFSCKKLL
jgi:hypothetical protein